MKNKLIIFTDSYPYGDYDMFIEPELPLLSKYYKQIIIIPKHQPKGMAILPSNCEVKIIQADFNAKHKIRHYLFKWWFSILKAMLYTFIKTKHKRYYFSHFKKMILDLTFYFEEGEVYLKELSPILDDTSVLYFFWFDKPFIQLSLLRARGKITQKLISRGLGYDYDITRKPDGIFPYRELELKAVDKVLLNSKWGAELMKREYPGFAEKFEVSYLGIPATNEVNPAEKSEEFKIVSCSYVVDIKRVHLIVDILKHLSFNVCWTHIGKGPLLESVREQAKALPANIRTVFAGFVPSVTDYYQKNPTDLFITTTYVEGLPVSAIEAIAYGIPVLGTDVCGNPEVINKQTGFLIPRDFDPVGVANIITEYRFSTNERKALLRQSAKTYFLSQFTTEKNIQHLARHYFGAEVNHSN